MNHPNYQDYERRLQEIEVELEPDSGRFWQPTRQDGFPDSHPVKSVLNQLTNWFNRLPTVGKVIVVIMAASIGFSVLRSVLQLVASVISLALLGTMLYLAYRFFITSQSRQ
ncbi:MULTISPECIES: hypothetical protein [unclassified Coleofasciculus]|uniref:hypothetical protein n=1 Tax=unclassified Coleofasciculus TaxID=2692782 RepID=UPI001880B229|nr:MULTISPECIES: hypothetical protein [unclassified Coleofasciculus]MBE9126401.1 hypothetical protein [Coleofasciculus sp. LEGE 07081]MBE9149820.1 hypothetical protein [Coleofasciculus sp. LEGE 07092]